MFCGVHREEPPRSDHVYSRSVFSERIGVQSDGLVPHVTKEILEEIKDIHQQRMSERTGARQVDVPIPQVMEERVEVAR